MENSELMKLAVESMKKAYTPYSNFNVGAALLSKNGKVYTGCNIENAAYPATVCAERVALFKAVEAGEREFLKIAVCGGKNAVIEDFCPPCGVCRQALSEFCGKDFEILLTDGKTISVHTLGELLPHSFSF